MLNIPRAAEVCDPVLRILYYTGNIMHVQEFVEPICYYFLLPIPEVLTCNRYGISQYNREPIVSRVCSAICKLHQAGLVNRVRRGFYAISNRGIQLVEANIVVNISNLRRIKEYREYEECLREHRFLNKTYDYAARRDPVYEYVIEDREPDLVFEDLPKYGDGEYVENFSNNEIMQTLCEDTRFQNIVRQANLIMVGGKLTSYEGKSVFVNAQDVENLRAQIKNGEAEYLSLKYDCAQKTFKDVEISNANPNQRKSRVRNNYAPKEWEYLYNRLKDKKFSEVEGEKKRIIKKIEDAYYNMDPKGANIGGVIDVLSAEFVTAKNSTGGIIGFTDAEIINRINWGRTQYYEWHNNKTKPRFDQMGAVCMSMMVLSEIIDNILCMADIKRPKEYRADFRLITTEYFDMSVAEIVKFTGDHFQRAFFSNDWEW